MHQGQNEIPLRKTVWHKLVALRIVSQKKHNLITPDELIKSIATLQKEAAVIPKISVKTAALWKMESLGFTYGSIAKTGDSLSNYFLPNETLPIVHVGMGAGVVESTNFDRNEIIRKIEAFSHPGYSLFAYESLGAMLNIYDGIIFRMMLGLKHLNCPNPARFIELFPPEVQRLIAHGYGRLLYLNSKSISSACRKVVVLQTCQRQYAAIQGIAFGYAMMNHREINRVLETTGTVPSQYLRAFKAGLVYALEFWEWASPGFLGLFKNSSVHTMGLINIARQEIERSRKRGRLDPFLVQF